MWVDTNITMDTFKYFAFISYNQQDTAWGKLLQRKLESYKMPADLCRKHGWKNRKPIRPIFFAPTDIQPGDLSMELKQRLRSAQNLIIICSPSSAKSEWVGREIKYFCELGRKDKVFFFIVEGIPNSGEPATECFNPIVKELGMSEVLGANINEKFYKLRWLNRERVCVQLVTKLLGVEFDSIWQRHKRQLAARISILVTGFILIIMALILTWKLSQPFNASFSVCDQQIVEELPPLKNASITLFLDDEQKTKNIAFSGDTAVFAYIPHRFLGKKTKISIICNRYLPLDTVVALDKNVNLILKRDASVFGHIHFTIYDGKNGVPNVELSIEGMQTISDSQGQIDLQVPIEKQKTFYIIKTSIPLETDTIFMPCGKDDVIYIK